MAQQFRIFVVLTEDLDSVHSSQLTAHNHGMIFLLASVSTHTHTGKQTHKIKILFKKLETYKKINYILRQNSQNEN